MTVPEFSRPQRLDTIGTAPRLFRIEAEANEREGLARRFGLVSIESLAADLAVGREGDAFRLTGSVRAQIVQACAASGVELNNSIEAPLELRYRRASIDAPEEIELSESELDLIDLEGEQIDAGEAAAETLALAIDPFARAPDADQRLAAAGVRSEEEAGPFGALASLRKRLSGKPE